MHRDVDPAVRARKQVVASRKELRLSLGFAQPAQASIANRIKVLGRNGIEWPIEIARNRRDGD